MKSTRKVLMFTLLAVLLLAAAAVAAALAMWGSFEPFGDAVIHIDDSTLTLSQFGLGGWLATIGGVSVGLAVAGLVILIVVPLAVLLPLLIVALVLGGVVVALAAAAALACSPLILGVGAVWLVWRLARGPAAGRDQQASGQDADRTGATISR